jgi:protein-S-isoprenylcysteine O-methyltransferase Ste14
MVAILLLLYWIPPYLIGSGQALKFENTSIERYMWAIMLGMVGVCVMIGADIQKNATLRIKKGLISDGFNCRSRNPNYVGEVMIYASFATITGSTFFWACLISIWFSLFLINMLTKENSYRAKLGWQEYKQNSNMFLPRII